MGDAGAGPWTTLHLARFTRRPCRQSGHIPSSKGRDGTLRECLGSISVRVWSAAFPLVTVTLWCLLSVQHCSKHLAKFIHLISHNIPIFAPVLQIRKLRPERLNYLPKYTQHRVLIPPTWELSLEQRAIKQHILWSSALPTTQQKSSYW